MKIHSLSLQNKRVITPINYKAKSFQFKENNEEFHNKKNKNIIKINFQKILLNEKNEKSQNEDNSELKNDKKENKKVSTYNNIVPQKVLKFSQKHLNLRKNNTEKNINIYENALMDKLQFIITNTNNNYQNKTNKINSKIKFDLSPIQKQNNLFDNFKDYQKEFLSSSYNFHINGNKNNIKKYSTIEFVRDKSSSLTPYPNKTNINFNRNIIYKIPYKHSNKSFASRSISNILLRKKHGEIPIILNSPITFIKNYKSNSEKERDEKNSKSLFRLRDFLDMYWDKRNKLVTEFFNEHQVADKEYYSLKKLENFAHYIFDNINVNTNIIKGIIETRIPMKEIIDKGVQYKNYSLKKMKNSNSMPAFSDINLIEHKNKNQTDNNWFNSNQTQIKMKDNNINNFSLKKSRMIENKGEINVGNCFNIDNYMNENYQISDKEKGEKKIINDKIYKYKKYLDKNYGQKINNKFLKDYNQNEKINYFHKRKIGKIDIPDRKNLANNIQKQSEFYKLKSTSFSLRKNDSIHSLSENDFKELYNELNKIKENYTIFGDEKENELNEKGSQDDNIWIKMYEDVKKNKFEKNPETILKKKKKLLEYIIFQNIKRRKDLEKDLLK